MSNAQVREFKRWWDEFVPTSIKYYLEGSAEGLYEDDRDREGWWIFKTPAWDDLPEGARNNYRLAVLLNFNRGVLVEYDQKMKEERWIRFYEAYADELSG